MRGTYAGLHVLLMEVICSMFVNHCPLYMPVNIRICSIRDERCPDIDSEDSICQCSRRDWFCITL